ncbi:hypothetical protein N7471_009032 [Penicillium samsonianum]|uniref:uncharacterized protein n=1 Tax=Penicillium samsonianum TaxID=1882272 RepID=UPI00254662AD|nr:uncharacterized protein N7471_009032 [Penicillium samsonianum]KAJ6127815.1 hypothetical protein N7471_009032 [Penicillium samsonianum]
MYYPGITTFDSWKQWPDTPKLMANSLEVLLIDLVAGSDFSEFVIFAWVHHLAYQVPVPCLADKGGNFER